MKIYQRIIYIILLLYLILYPILPTYSGTNADILIYILFILQLTAFVLLKSDRNNVITIMKNLFNDKIFLSLILLNITMYLSTFVANDIVVTLTHSIKFSMYVFIFYSLSYKLKSSSRIYILFRAFISIVIISGLYTLYQLLYTTNLGYKIDKTTRMTSFLENSNNLAAYTILSFFIVIMLFITTKGLKYRIFYGVSSFLLFVNIIFSQSRNAIIALVLGIVILAILYDLRFSFVAIIISLILYTIPPIKSRILQIFDMSQNSSRFKIWEISRQMIVDKPISGIGYENFSVKFPTYVELNPELHISEGYLAIHPHNVFLKIQTELGILGTLALIFFILTTFISLYKLIKVSTDTKVKAMLIGITTGYLTFLFMNLLDCYFSAPKVICTLLIILGFTNYYKIYFFDRNEKVAL